MKARFLLNQRNSLYQRAILPILVVFMVMGFSMNTNAQKYELTGTESQITQATEITLSNTTVAKIYYLFRVDDADQFSYVTFVVGQGFPVKFAPQTTAGKYVVYEFDEFKSMPFDFEKYNPDDGILQNGEVIISTENNN